jgi:hypothetical protein
MRAGIAALALLSAVALAPSTPPPERVPDAAAVDTSNVAYSPTDTVSVVQDLQLGQLLKATRLSLETRRISVAAQDLSYDAEIPTRYRLNRAVEISRLNVPMAFHLRTPSSATATVDDPYGKRRQFRT